MKVAMVGISGAVGTTLLELFARHAADDIDLSLYGSARSAGETRLYKGQSLRVREFRREALADQDVIFLCVSGDFAQAHARSLAKHSLVIDNSSAFRRADDVPLLMPRINGSGYRGEKLLANPNCSSAIALMALAPLETHVGLEHVQLSTYQAASGAGAPAMAELKAKLGAFTAYGEDDRSDFFHYNLAYNVIPHIDAFCENGYTKEEMKAVWELRKILGRPDLAVAATCVRVPTLRSHAEALSVKLRHPVTLSEVRQWWRQMPGLSLVDNFADNRPAYPMPLSSSLLYDVEVGRLRHSLIYGSRGLDFFVSGDQLLRGAALNAYEIFCLTQGLSLPAEYGR
ncbi:MAG: aspartate-semialdehyde dehydrogenase [Spirochaetota bacterium]